MRKTISSPLTFINKFIGPPIGIVASVGGGIIVLVSDETDFFLPMIMIPVCLLVIVDFYFFGIRLKKVEMDEEKLYISNYRTTIGVHRSRIRSVSQNKWYYIHPVYIKFSTPTEFGDKIVFMPEVQPFTFPHPIVGELKSWIERR